MRSAKMARVGYGDSGFVPFTLSDIHYVFVVRGDPDQRIFLSPVVMLRMETIQLHAKQLFLYADIDETNYMEPPRAMGVMLRGLRAELEKLQAE